MTAPAPPDLSLGPEWAVLELLCRPPRSPGRDAQIRVLLSDRSLHWGELIEQAIRHKLLPLLADHLASGRHDDLIAGPLAAHLRQALRANQHRTRIYRAEALTVTAALADTSVPAAVTRGLALEATLYAGKGTRTFSDLDLLVPPSREHRASQILVRLGYQSARPGSYGRRVDDPITPTLIVDLATRWSSRTSSAEPADDVDAILNRRTWQPAPGHPADARLPVPATADHALLLSLALFNKAWHASARGSDVTLLAFADLLRLWTTTPELQQSHTLATSPAWATARRPTQWVLAQLDRLFGTTILKRTGFATDVDEAWLASTGDRQGRTQQWHGTMRPRLHAKTPPGSSSNAAADRRPTRPGELS